MSEPLDLAGPIRVAILANSAITPLLAVWEGEPAVYTRRPVSDDAPYPLIVVSNDISIGNQDFLSARIPTPRRDVLVYGEQPDDYRTVESIAYLLRQQFHRQRFSVDATPWYQVIDIVATGPMTAPSDDERIVGRMVALQFRLLELAV